MGKSRTKIYFNSLQKQSLRLLYKKTAFKTFAIFTEKIPVFFMLLMMEGKKALGGHILEI